MTAAAHTNVALAFSGPAAYDLLRTEDAVLAFTDRTLQPLSSTVSSSNNDQQEPPADIFRYTYPNPDGRKIAGCGFQKHGSTPHSPATLWTL